MAAPPERGLPQPRVLSGAAGPGSSSFIGEVRGIEYVPITFEIADDLAYWAAEFPGKATARAEPLTGPTAPDDKRVQVHNPPGAKVGPRQVATWGRARPIVPTASALRGNGTAARVSTSPSIGKALSS
jgi:hypothetical protein